MSNDTTQPTDTPDDFVPADPPQVIDGAVDDASAVNEAPAPAAAPAPQPTLSAQAVNPFETLATVVLESAEVANRSAQAAATSTAALNATAEQLRKTQTLGLKQAKWMLIAAASVMVITLLFFLIMGIRMSSRVAQLDETLLAVGKRTVELNVAVGTMDGVQATLTELSPRLEAMAAASSQIESRMEAAIQRSEALVSEVPAQTAQQVTTASEQLSKQVQGLDTKLQTQNTAVANVTRELQAMRAVVRDVDRLNKEVQALITLQRERYLEALRQNQSRANVENNVQFPRRQADESPVPAADPAPTDNRIVVSPPRQ